MNIGFNVNGKGWYLDEIEKKLSTLKDIPKEEEVLISSNLDITPLSSLSGFSRFFWNVVGKRFSLLAKWFYGVDPARSQNFLNVTAKEIKSSKDVRIARLFNEAVVNYNSRTPSRYQAEKIDVNNLSEKDPQTGENKFDSQQLSRVQVKTEKTKKTQSLEMQPELVAFKEYCKDGAYIHGTSSSVLVHFPKTDQSLVSVWEMLQRKLAPISGEIYTYRELPFVNTEPCFGDLTGKSTYNLNTVMERYAINPLQNETSLEETKHHYEMMRAAIGGYRFTFALLEATRAFQKGGNFSQIEGMDVDKMRECFHKMGLRCVNQYLSVKIIAEYVERDPKKAIPSRDLAIELDTFLSQNGIELEILDEYSILKDFLNEKGYVLRDTPRKSNAKDLRKVEYASEMIVDIGRGTNYDAVEAAIGCPEATLAAYEHRKSYIEEVFIYNLDHFYFLEQVLTTKCPNPIKDEGEYLSKPFPLIFFTKKDMMKVGNEFRSKTPIKLGRDVIYIGTERQSLSRLKQYLQKHGLNNVTPLAFDDIVNLVPKQK